MIKPKELTMDELMRYFEELYDEILYESEDVEAGYNDHGESKHIIDHYGGSATMVTKIKDGKKYLHINAVFRIRVE